MSLIVSLYRLQGHKELIKAHLGSTQQYWTKKSAPSVDLTAAELPLLESTNPEDLQAAAEFFKNLRKKDSSDHVAIAGYIAAAASTDITLVENDLA